MLYLDDCIDCLPAQRSGQMQRRIEVSSTTTISLSLVPFIATLVAVAVYASQHVFPAITGEATAQAAREGLPQYKGAEKRQTYTNGSFRRPNTQLIARLVFAVSIGLSAVLAELLLCEISNTLHPTARSIALRFTLTSLLALSVLITPAIEIHSFAGTLLSPSPDSTSTKKATSRTRIVLELGIFGAWLLVFWYIPQVAILRDSLVKANETIQQSNRVLTEACLERVGIIGVSIMALLAGFAAVSSLWQTFGVKYRLVKEADLTRKEAGLAATEEMLNAKQSRLRAVQLKMSESSTATESKGFMSRIAGTFSGSSESQEARALEMEVSGLETMRFTLSQSLSTLRSRYAEQQMLRTRSGRVLNLFNTVFAVYCAYRICATTFSTMRRWWQPNAAFATTDPINNFLALLTAHWDNELDRAAWSRQISFLLSGFMLMASFSAVLQTFRLFSRFAPALLLHAQTSLPLVISQVAGTYVISSALLLRSNLPAEVSGVIAGALGDPLETSFVEAWFESWFLVAVGLTAAGILVGRKIAGSSDDWDDDGMEQEKRS